MPISIAIHLLPMYTKREMGIGAAFFLGFHFSHFYEKWRNGSITFPNFGGEQIVFLDASRIFLREGLLVSGMRSGYPRCLPLWIHALYALQDLQSAKDFIGRGHIDEVLVILIASAFKV